MRARKQPARRGQEHAVDAGGRRSAPGTPKNREVVPQDNDFEFLELIGPRAQRHECEEPTQQQWEPGDEGRSVPNCSHRLQHAISQLTTDRFNGRYGVLHNALTAPAVRSEPDEIVDAQS